MGELCGLSLLGVIADTMLTARTCATYLQFILLIILAACRSERMEPHFQPLVTQGKMQHAAAVEADSTVAPHSPATYLSTNFIAVPRYSPIERAHRPKRLTNGNARGPECHKQLFSPRKVQNYVSHKAVVKTKRLIDSPTWDVFLFLFGGTVTVAAVIIGLNLGGLLGLMVGTLLFIAGSYLIARGYGGPEKPAS